MRALAALLVVLSTLSALAPATAAAQRHRNDERRARRLFAEGDRLYQEGRYEEAINAFEEAYSLSERPLLLFNIANAQERLGNWVDALENLRRYYDDAPAAERETLDARMRSLEERIDAAAQAEQNRERDRPAPETRTIIVQQMQAPETDDGPSLALPIALIAGGGALITGGVIFGVVALGARSDAEAMCVESGGAVYCPSSAGSALTTDTTFSILADVGITLGLAASALGVYFLITSGGGEEEGDASARAGVSPLAGGARLTLDGTF